MTVRIEQGRIVEILGGTEARVGAAAGSQGWTGRIVEILGGTEASMVEAYFASLDDPNMYRVAGYVYGFNPGVTKITGRLNQDERFFGCVCFEFGASATRVAAGDFNGVTMRPSVWLDEVEIEREGRYVHPDLVAICRQMRIPGY